MTRLCDKSDSMHILIISEGFYPETDARASRMTEHARHWVAMGHTVTVVCAAPNFPRGIVYDGYQNVWRATTVEEGVTVHRIWSFISPNKGIVRRLASFLCFTVMALWHGWRVTRYEKPDIILGTCPSLFAPCAAGLLARIRKRPFVFEVRDLWPESAVGIGMVRENSVPYRVMERIARWLYTSADMLVPSGRRLCRPSG